MGFTSVPAAGSKLRASVLSSLITEVRPLFAVKSSDETVNNSAVFQSDDHLTLSVASSTTYHVEAWWCYTSGTTPDIKFRWSVPTGATLRWSAVGTNISGTFAEPFLDTATEPGFAGNGSDAIVRVMGLLVTSNAGTLLVQWAQQTANASNTVLKAGSWLKLTKVV